MSTPMTVVQLPMLSDNYSYLIICNATQTTAVVDPAEAGPVIAALSDRGLRLNAILCTHHHFDHIGGNPELVSQFQPRVYGHRADQSRINTMTDAVEHDDTVQVGKLTARVLFTPAHTSAHIAYHFADQQKLFCGDTLFAGGCGRLFEGTPAQMHHALNDLFAAMPNETEIYCGHEYTESNLRFALTLEPNNTALQRRMAWVKARRAEAQPTVPSTIGEEKATNPFMRCDAAELISNLRATSPGLDPDDPVSVLGATRALKDRS